MNDVIRLAAIAALAIGIFAAGAWLYTRGQQDAESSALQAVDASVFERPHSPVIGPDDAPVTVVEFFDPECETCRAVHAPVKSMLGKWPGQVRLVMRYMPFHQNSVYAAGALEAAREQGRFRDMLDVLFENQPDWGNHQRPRPELIPEYAKQIGLDMARFEAFLEAGEYRQRVEIDKRDGEALGVQGTPTFYVNRKPLPAASLQALHDLIAEEIERAR